MRFARILDWVFVVFFAVHIPVAFLLDFQALLPKYMFPQTIQDMLWWYCHTYKDPIMLEPPVWFQSFIFIEIFAHLPFFPVAMYAFYKGCKWIRIPAMVYGAHLATLEWAILWYIWFHDFSSATYPHPETTMEKVIITAWYLPFFVCPLLILLKCGLSSEYTSQSKPKMK